MQIFRNLTVHILDIIEAGINRQVAISAQPLIKPRAFRQDPHRPADFRIIHAHLESIDPGCSRCRGDQAGEHPDGRGLPRPIRTQEAKDLSLGD